jgi:hypothetical protein
LSRRFTKRFLLAMVACLCLSALAIAADSTFLPKSFAGWTQTGQPQITTDAAQADAAYPALLKEYGFSDAETVTYTRDDGRKLTIKAARFADATGAYGAFTFYRQPGMGTEQIGTKAASANNRVLFFRSNVLVEANFDRVGAMSASELRDLAAMLPAANGPAGNLPNLPEYLPKKDAVQNSAKYVLGPQALVAAKSLLTAEQVDFAFQPEVLTQDYTSKNGDLTLTLIDYPTPQIAGERFRALQGAQKGSGNFLERRTGPILEVVSGAIGSSEARDLLNSVNYEAEVTWNEATTVSPRNNIGNLILAVFALIGIILLFSLIFGVFFGGIRIVMKRLFPDKVFDRPEEVEIIQLHLKGPTGQ